ncbi:GDSL family lipase [Desulfitobacterium metallireducens DSM 15288]|uniref:GDSL family lipase n=1 Tax=Desulfitobacterium metallireducens DSM 15288 TaxID=871968 RepID=W0EF85_9FIRM|nr:GDSL family lipase [Desulfitobacterium metallireducens DSM 15288]
MYLALGDSITTGYGVGSNQSFANLYYKNLLSFDPSLRYINLGVNGLTSEELAAMVGQKRFHTLIAQAKFISLTIGSNDLLAVGKGLISGSGSNIDLILGNFNHNLRLIGGQIRAINPSVLVKVATIYNPLPPMDKETDAFAKGLVKAANHSILNQAREFHFVVVPVAKALREREQLLLGPDHLHPNVGGHRLMADLFTRN